MKRLTIRNSDGSVSQPTTTTFEMAMYKLAEYEDLEEQGRLVRLPCKVGDTVYTIDENKVVTHTVNYLTIDSDCITLNIEITDELFDVDIDIDVEAIGKTVFLTREEAEAALKGARDAS